MTGPEVWEPHPVYPHDGSSLGRIRTRKGRILAQRPSNRPEGDGDKYQLADLWLPGADGASGRKITVSVHSFITECHWGLKRYRRQVARHGSGGPADNSWENLLGWGFPEDNERDKPAGVRSAAARTARAAQLAAAPRRKRRQSRKVTLVVSFWPPRIRRKRRVTAVREPVSKPVTNEAA